MFMLHIALWEPEIPPNTGNIARLCAATGVRLHLIGRLGFRIDDRSLKRAGIDYWHAVDLVRHESFEKFLYAIAGQRIWCVDNPAPKRYTEAAFQDGDVLLFGNEGSGLPATIREQFPDTQLMIPMPTGHVRSINLATAAGIVLYEALRQVHQW